MKKILTVILCMTLSFSIFAQETKDKHLAKLPAVDIQTLDGAVFNTKDIQNDGKPVIISLWATWCNPASPSFWPSPTNTRIGWRRLA